MAFEFCFLYYLIGVAFSTFRPNHTDQIDMILIDIFVYFYEECIDIFFGWFSQISEIRIHFQCGSKEAMFNKNGNSTFEVDIVINLKGESMYYMEG